MDKRKSAAITYEGERYYTKGKTQAEANRKAGEKLAALKRGEKKESTLVYDKWFMRYLDTYRKGVKKDTRDNYISIYKSSIKPKIGSYALKRIKQAECIDILNSVADRSKSYVHKVFVLLNGSLEAASDNDLIRKNPMKGIIEPDAEEGHRRPLSPEERRLFLQAADRCGDAGYFCKIIYYCGLRPSEVARLRYEDFDRNLRIVTVHEGKTENAIRRVGVPDALPLPEKEGLLFPTKTGKPKNRDGQRGFWLRVKLEMEKIAGHSMPEDLVMYCLRHDYGTRCVEADVNMETISKTMGHSNVGFTSKIYLHQTDELVLNALSRINNYVDSVDKSVDNNP